MTQRRHPTPVARLSRRRYEPSAVGSWSPSGDAGRLMDLQRSIGNRSVTALLQRMPYDSLATGRYYRVKDRRDVLFLKQRHRQDGCRFTRHEDDLLVASVSVPSFDDVEREATAAEITDVRAGRLLRVHTEALVRADQINRQLTENSVRITSARLDTKQHDELRTTNRGLSEEMFRLLQPVITALFHTATDYAGVRVLMAKFLRGELPGTPWVNGRLMPESSAIARHLQDMTELGFITYESQPSGQSRGFSHAPGVHEHQKAYLEISGPGELMAALQKGIVGANSTQVRRIVAIEPGQEAMVALRTLVGPSAQTILEVHKEATVTEEDGRHVAQIPMLVRNNDRYRRRLVETNLPLSRAMEGHITLVLVSSTYLDEDAIVFFDDLIELMLGAVARVEAEAEAAALAEAELTPEEAHVGHIAELK